MKKYAYSIGLSIVALFTIIGLITYPAVQAHVRPKIELQQVEGDPSLLERIHLLGAIVAPHSSEMSEHPFTYDLVFENGKLEYTDLQSPLESVGYHSAQTEDTRKLFAIGNRPKIRRASRKVTVGDRYELWLNTAQYDQENDYEVGYTIVDREQRTVKTGSFTHENDIYAREKEMFVQAHGDVVTITMVTRLDDEETFDKNGGKPLDIRQISLTTGEVIAERKVAAPVELQSQSFPQFANGEADFVDLTNKPSYSLTAPAYSVVASGSLAQQYYQSSLATVELAEQSYVVNFATLEVTPFQLTPEVLALRNEVQGIEFYVAQQQVYYLVKLIDPKTYEQRFELWCYNVEKKSSHLVITYAGDASIVLQHGRYVVALNEKYARTNDLKVVDLQTQHSYEGTFVSEQPFFLQPEGVDYWSSIKYDW